MAINYIWISDLLIRKSTKESNSVSPGIPSVLKSLELLIQIYYILALLFSGLTMLSGDDISADFIFCDYCKGPVAKAVETFCGQVCLDLYKKVRFTLKNFCSMWYLVFIGENWFLEEFSIRQNHTSE